MVLRAMPASRWISGFDQAGLGGGPDHLITPAVLFAAAGTANRVIAERLGICQGTARKWRRRYGEQGIGGLADAPRPGRPRVFPARVVAGSRALACEMPAASRTPLARWTCPQLARHATASGIAPAPSASSGRHWLADDALKPWQHRWWIFPATRSSPFKPPVSWTSTGGNGKGSRSAATSTCSARSRSPVHGNDPPVAVGRARLGHRPGCLRAQRDGPNATVDITGAGGAARLGGAPRASPPGALGRLRFAGHCPSSPDRRHEMSKIRWLLAAAGMVLIGLVPILGATSAASADPGTILKFTVMTPVTGPYTGTANPIRTVPGGGLPWIITSGNGSLTRDGKVLIHVRGLVLADQAPVPPSLQGTNPIPDFNAIVSCQTIGAGDTATITNVSTGLFPATTAGNSDINARVKLPQPCIAPIVLVGNPAFGWFAATGS